MFDQQDSELGGLLHFGDENQFCEVVNGQYKRLRINFKIAPARFPDSLYSKKSRQKRWKNWIRVLVLSRTFAYHTTTPSPDSACLVEVSKRAA